MKTHKIIFSVLVLMMGFFSVRTVLAQGTEDTTAVGVIEHLGSMVSLNLSFTDENNMPIQLKQLITKPTLLSLVYFDCQGVCPMILSSVSSVVEKMDMEPGKDYNIVTVSFNSQDSPDKAKDKKAQFLRPRSKLHPEAWSYLTGDSINIHKLTDGVGFKFEQAGNDFIHPACIIILSPDGKITRYLYGTNFLPFDVKMALIEAQRGIARPTISRVLDFCFSYDPSGRRYTLEVTKVSGVIILFCAFVLLGTLLIRSRVRKSKSNEPRT
jgi:protein SCO1